MSSLPTTMLGTSDIMELGTDFHSILIKSSNPHMVTLSKSDFLDSQKLSWSKMGKWRFCVSSLPWIRTAPWVIFGMFIFTDRLFQLLSSLESCPKLVDWCCYWQRVGQNHSDFRAELRKSLHLPLSTPSIWPTIWPILESPQLTILVG